MAWIEQRRRADGGVRARVFRADSRLLSSHVRDPRVLAEPRIGDKPPTPAAEQGHHIEAKKRANPAEPAEHHIEAKKRANPAEPAKHHIETRRNRSRLQNRIVLLEPADLRQPVIVRKPTKPIPSRR
jgi:hypothetical protein